jgi:LPXTG-motif cell wall-anchored protein
MPGMGAFRLAALAYALAVFLIAPSWLAAEEEPEATVPPAQVAVPVGAVQEATPTVPELPAVAPAADAAQPDDPEAEPAPKPEPEEKAQAAPAKSGHRQEQKKDEPAARSAATASVTISDFKFTPATVTVNEGDTVTWTNDGPTVHTATAEDGSFDTGILEKGESGSATFTQPGTINYICSPHPYMKGKVVVQAATSGSDPGSGPGGSTDGGSGDTGGLAGENTTSAGDGSGLPSTGGETLSILLLGAATLGLGLLLRRRRET